MVVSEAPVIAKVDIFNVALEAIDKTPATEKPTPAVVVPLVMVRLLKEVNTDDKEQNADNAKNLNTDGEIHVQIDDDKLLDIF